MVAGDAEGNPETDAAMTEPVHIAALRAAVDDAPDNHGLRLALASALVDNGKADDALAEYVIVMRNASLPAPQLAVVAELALANDNLGLAGECVELAMRSDEGGGPRWDAVRAELTERLQSGFNEITATHEELDILRVSIGSEGGAELTTMRSEPVTTFAHVAGHDAVKKSIDRAIIMPFRKPELYAKYGRRPGGGSILYGPPGCGKTMLARATAGECALPFHNLRIEDVLSAYRGGSERQLAAAFEMARSSAPCVLFLDELDAVGYTRMRQSSDSGRTLVNVLLTQLDSIGSDNTGLLILAATNAPWDLDDALKRSGRFDHYSFVPPPDEAARRFLIEAQLVNRPAGRVDSRKIARATPLYSGADLVALVERAVDETIDETLASGDEVPISQHHFEAALASGRATTIEWLLAASNHAEYANRSGQYDELAAYLKQRDVKRMLGR